MDERKIVIEVQLKNAGGTSPNPSPDNVPDDETKEKSSKTTSAITTILMHEFYNQAKAMVKNMATYEVGKYFSLTEDYMNETNMQNTLNVIGKVASFGTAMFAGAKLGGLPGVAIASVGWVGNEIYSMYQKAEQQQLQLNTTNYETAFARTRAGLSDNGRGTLN